MRHSVRFPIGHAELWKCIAKLNTMRIARNHGSLGRLVNFQRRTTKHARALGAVLALSLLQACGSGSTVLSGAPVAATSIAALTTSNQTPNGAGASTQTSAAGTGTSSGDTVKSGTTTNTNNSSNTVTPSYASDPEAALQRIHSTINLLRGFEKFLGDPFGSQLPTANKDGDFRYFDCSGQRYCAGTVSQTRTFKTLGTNSAITPGTAYAWYFQNYNTNGAMAIPTIALNGTAYLAFPEGFTVGTANYQGKATLYIKTKPPEEVIDFEGSISATNLSSQSSVPFNTVGRLEITPNNQPTWTIDFDNWRTYQGPGIEGSKLKITESGQTTELAVELAGDTETIYALTYSLNGQVATSRIRKTWDGGAVKFVSL
jgi:hypothetical protein